MPLEIILGDITKLKADAIVNAANAQLKMGGGVSGAIFNAAGPSELQAACDLLAPIQTGQAVITLGFNLPAKHIIHAVGPIYDHYPPKQSEQLLYATYISALKLAFQHDCHHVAFPLISSGIYGYPKAEALQVATQAIKDFLAEHELNVTLVMYDMASFDIGRRRDYEIDSYIKKKYTKRHKTELFETLTPKMGTLREAFDDFRIPSSIDGFVSGMQESFSTMLFDLIDGKQMNDVDVYKRANIDRKLFSKIRSNKGYIPSKRTVIALGIALSLSLKEMDELLKRAGYALSRAVKFDVIVEYFIITGVYDVYKINEALFKYEQPLLGGNFNL